MGLDIYAGTLTRYYAHNWKSAVQQWAEENGYARNTRVNVLHKCLIPYCSLLTCLNSFIKLKLLYNYFSTLSKQLQSTVMPRSFVFKMILSCIYIFHFRVRRLFS